MLGLVSIFDFTEVGECMLVMYNNNFGCIYFYFSKYYLGAFYFRKVFQENENVIKDIKRGVEYSKLVYFFVVYQFFLFVVYLRL